MRTNTTHLPMAISAWALVAGLFPLAPTIARADSIEGFVSPALSEKVTAPKLAAARTRSVSYADLNLSHPEGMITLNSRIMRAVGSVCPQADIRDPRASSAEAECREAAIADATAQVQARTGRLLVVAR